MEPFFIYLWGTLCNENYIEPSAGYSHLCRQHPVGSTVGTPVVVVKEVVTSNLEKKMVTFNLVDERVTSNISLALTTVKCC